MKKTKFAVVCLFIIAAIIGVSSTVFANPYVNMELRYDGMSHWYSAESVNLEINGRKIGDLTMPPILLDNYTLVPAREVFENLGADVKWLPDNRQVQIHHENTEVLINIDSTIARVNGANTSMDIPAKIINDKTMVPLRFVSQAINKQVSWDGSSRTVHVDDKEATTETTTETTTAATTVTTTVTTTQTTTETTTETTTAKPSRQDINKIEFDSEAGRDVISIIGSNYAPDVNVVQSTDGKLLTIDIENGELTAEKADFGKGTFVKNGYYYQLSSKFVRISLELDYTSGYAVNKNGKTTTVTLSEDISPNVNADYNTSNADYSYIGDNFSFENNKLIISNTAGKINFANVIYDDRYLDGVMVITIPADLSSVLKTTSFTIGNDYVESVDINCTSSKTVITVHENRILAVNEEKAGNYAVFNFVHPKEKYKKILVLDAGHGGHDNGAGGNGLIEKDLTLSMLTKTVKLFEDDGEIKVYCTRMGDTYPTLYERQDMGSDLGDAFVSIHINSASSSASGTETYCLYPNDHGNGLTSYMLAESILNNLVNRLGTVDRGVKSEEFIVIKGTAPSTLLEIGFISNYSEAMMMATDDCQNKVASSIYDSVKQLFNEHPPVR